MPDSTRQRILDTAERLFADQGFHTTTLRQITREARVNLAAVNYHHGSKDALILSVFQRKLDQLNDERLRQLERVMAESDPPELERILEAFVHPALLMSTESAGDGGRFMRLLMRAWAENATHLQGIIARQYSHVMRAFAGAVSRALGTPPDNLRRQLDFLIGALTYTMAETRDADVETTARALVRFGCAGLRESVARASSHSVPEENIA
ncbi:MAG: TetR/AcrR family transcriptional regulator [Wenzhouxiangellaceae bacterium]|nr:TetR/AcrR family transcriptional regulator [Wenzhouxiangellaceae bacterium]